MMHVESVIRKVNKKNRLSAAAASTSSSTVAKLASKRGEMEVSCRLATGTQETINHQVVVVSSPATFQDDEEPLCSRRVRRVKKTPGRIRSSTVTSERIQTLMQLPLISSSSSSSSPSSVAARLRTSSRSALLLLIGLLLLVSTGECKLRSQVNSDESSTADIELSSLLDSQSAVADDTKLYRTLQAFDASSYLNVYEAIRHHEELQEFAKLCDTPEVKEIVNVTKIPLTVFAPIDRSLRDLLNKSKSRSSINLVELARHHLASSLVTPDEHTKFPLQFSSYPNVSPLYLNQVQQVQVAQVPGKPASQSALYVNNARILASYLIPVGDSGDTFQALHIIDQPIEYAYSSRRTQVNMRNTGAGQQSSSAGSSRMAASNRQQVVTKKHSLNLDELGSLSLSEQVATQPLVDFHETFSDILAQSLQADLFKTRTYRGSGQVTRLALERDQLASIRRITNTARHHLPEFRGQLYQVNDTSAQLNTYFLPLDSEELNSLLRQQPDNQQVLASNLRALIIPNQVLFTRTMQLGRKHESASPRVALSLAKSLPDHTESFSSTARFLATPLLLQAECSLQSAPDRAAPSADECREGVTSAEIILANIPLSHGVLHLIKKPLLWSHNNLLDYLNGDVDAELSSQVNSLGSRTKQPAALEQQLPVTLNRFRELLSKQRQLLSLHANQMNMTILVPSDEAFSSLRFDLRALINQDESMIPKEWDQAYRAELLEKLVRRHIIINSVITGDRILQQQQLEAQGPLSIESVNGKLLTFSQEFYPPGELPGNSFQLQVQCDSERARFLHRDLIASNGVLHIIDRVLGEQQETVYSLLRSIMLRLAANKDDEITNELSTHDQHLAELINNNLRDLSAQQQQQQTTISTSESTLNSLAPSKDSEELALISKSISQYLDTLNGSKRQVLHALASSVNISYQLAQLISQAEGSADWNEKLGEPENLFTYFVPSDLAWLRLQQAQPELYKPLTHFLKILPQDSQVNSASPLTSVDNSNLLLLSTSSPKSSRSSSKSSHRLRQILERHLVVNRKIASKDLSQMDSLETMGATLRLVESPQHHHPQQQQLSANPIDGSNGHLLTNSAFAAMQSSGGESERLLPGAATKQHQQLRLKTLRLGESSSANIVQVNEASNGFVYIIDNVLVLPDDSEFIVQTSSSPAVSSTMSSLLGAHNSAILDFFQGLFTPSPFNMSAQSVLILIGSLTVAITLLLLLALVLVMRRRCQNKLNRHQQLESGLTSGSSANSGSTSTTKSL